jgi:NADH:ubiquinone reductase (H+-translocating)
MTDSSSSAECVIIARADPSRRIRVMLVDQTDYHQVLAELPRVAAGTRGAHDARLPLTRLFQERIEFVVLHVTRPGWRTSDCTTSPFLGWPTAIELYSVDDARRLATIVIGGGGATGGELADALPQLASRIGLPENLPRVTLVEAGRVKISTGGHSITRRFCGWRCSLSG